METWKAYRTGKITGTKADIAVPKRGGSERIGFYELIAERLSVSDADFGGYVPNETPMDRGTRLQKYAVDRFRKEMGKGASENLVIWVRDDNQSIAVSPDAVVSDTEAVETKCLSSARHVEAYLTNEVPDEYKRQCLQYFVVNDLLKQLHLCFFDPRIPCKAFFYLTINREECEEKLGETPEKALIQQMIKLEAVDNAVARMSNF